MVMVAEPEPIIIHARITLRIINVGCYTYVSILTVVSRVAKEEVPCEGLSR